MSNHVGNALFDIYAQDTNPTGTGPTIPGPNNGLSGMNIIRECNENRNCYE